jgi:MFS family permease
MKSTLNQIEHIKNNGYSLDFSDVFNHAFENYKKIAVYAGLILLFISILCFFLGGGILISLYGAEHFNQQFFENLQHKQPEGTTLLIYTFAITFVTAIISPFTAGFLKMAENADKEEALNFSTVFTYYKAPYFGRLFISTLLIGLTSGLISVAFNFIGISFVDSIFAIVISLFTSLTVPLIIFGNLNIADAIKSSILIVSKQPLIIALLFIVAGIGSAIGFIGCCIGVVFTIPVTYSVKYAIYSAIIEIERPDSIDLIGQSDPE